jgi:hypothetical protein
VADLELTRGNDMPLLAHEDAVASVVDAVLATAPERLSRFRERITEDREENSRRFKNFKKAVADAARNSKWFSPAGLPVMVGAGIPLAVAGALMLWIGVQRFQSFAPRWNDVLLIAFGICALIGAAVVAIGLYNADSGAAARPQLSRRPSAGMPSGAT